MESTSEHFNFDSSLLGVLDRVGMQQDTTTLTALTALGLTTLSELVSGLQEIPDATFRSAGLNDLRRRKLSSAIRHDEEVAVNGPSDEPEGRDSPTAVSMVPAFQEAALSETSLPRTPAASGGDRSDDQPEKKKSERKTQSRSKLHAFYHGFES